MARAIIRWSINEDTSNVTGNAVTEILKSANADKLGTALYEVSGASKDDLFDTLERVLAVLRTPPGGGPVDHLWVYADGLKSD